MQRETDTRASLILGVNINLQYASIPKRHRQRMVACLEGLLQSIDETRTPVSLFFTGVSAEWLHTHRPQTVSTVKRLHKQGLVEVGSHTYAHAVLTLLPEQDQLWQVQWGERVVREVFDAEVKGVFVPEFGFGQKTAMYLARSEGSDYVIGPLGARSIHAFRTPEGLIVLQPSARGSQRLKGFLMGRTPLPSLSRTRSYAIVADAEYPYFAAEDFGLGLDRWLTVLRQLRGTHEAHLMGEWILQARLTTRRYAPRIPPKHRQWFRGIQDYDERVEVVGSALRARPDADPKAVQALLLAENSDAYECMTQGYKGNGWDSDAEAALKRASRLVGIRSTLRARAS